MSRPSIYEAAGGASAFQALAAAHHLLCLDDPVLNHPFSHELLPDHITRLGRYWAEVMGGPPEYSRAAGGHSGMLEIHAGCEADAELGERFVSCFLQALDNAGLPADPELRSSLHAYMLWAVGEVMSYSPSGSIVAPELPMPRWSWDGLVDASAATGA